MLINYYLFKLLQTRRDFNMHALRVAYFPYKGPEGTVPIFKSFQRDIYSV